ncbi:hypothetical protein [Kitasatospora sp. NPDC058190]|uniref:hypothetical protein n=1 Tax=Kitasatospora sp. NPDC058190 TaxID=3346371 RepID=UPI0036DDF376
MRSYTTKLTVAALAAATALSLAACGPDNPDPAATGGATGAAPAQTGAATGAASGGAAGGAAGGSTAAPSGAATGGGAAGGAANGGAATGGAATGGAADGGAATGGAGTAGAAGGGAGKIPQAGTTVKVGQSATVDFADKTSNVAAKLQITVTGIEVGSLQDLTAAKVPTAGLDGRTPVYVSYTIKNLGESSLSFTAPNSKFVVFDSSGGKGLPTLSAATPMPKCTGAKFQGIAKGAETKGCDIFTIAGNTPAAVGYTDLNDLLKLQASWAK